MDLTLDQIDAFVQHATPLQLLYLAWQVIGAAWSLWIGCKAVHGTCRGVGNRWAARRERREEKARAARVAEMQGVYEACRYAEEAAELERQRADFEYVAGRGKPITGRAEGRRLPRGLPNPPAPETDEVSLGDLNGELGGSDGASPPVEPARVGRRDPP